MVCCMQQGSGMSFSVKRVADELKIKGIDLKL